MSSDLEILLEFSEPVRKNDMIKIKVPSAFKLESLGTNSVQSHFGGYGAYANEYVTGSNTWTANEFYGIKPMKNYEGYMTSYYEGVSTGRESYYIPQSFELDYTLSGNTIQIYGL